MRAAISTALQHRPLGAPDGLRRFLAEHVFSPLDGMTLGDWLRFVRSNGREIDPIYWPRTAFMAVMAGVNSMASIAEQARYRKAVEGVKVRAPVFVLGHHRSGTTHLWNLLAQDPQFAFPSILQAVFPHSFLVFEPLVRSLATRLTIRTRPQDNVEIDPDSPIEEERAICAATQLSMQMVRHFPRRQERFRPYLTLRSASAVERQRWKVAFHRFARKLLVRHGADKTLLFKSPDHTGKIRVLLELFPDARFIHIHRDPFTVYASTQRMERRTGPVYAFHRWPDEQHLDELILWRYRAMYDAYFDDVPLIPPGQHVEVGFEELDENPRATLDRVYTSLGLHQTDEAREAINGYIARVAGYRKTAHPKLSREVEQRVVDAWLPTFERFGYPKRGAS